MADNDKILVKVKGNPSVKVTDDQTIVRDIKVGQPIKRIKQARFHASSFGGDSQGNSLLRDSNGTIVTYGNIVPSEDGQYDLGSPTNKFRGIYVGANTLYIGNLAISEDSNGNAVISSVDSSGFIISGTTKSIATDLDSSVVTNIIQPLIDSAFDLLLGDSTPETLDTLKEIATALNDDPNFFTGAWDAFKTTKEFIKAIVSIPSNMLNDITQDLNVPEWVYPAFWGIIVLAIVAAFLGILIRRDW